MTDALRDYEESEEETREIMEDGDMMDALRESGKGQTYSVEEIRKELDTITVKVRCEKCNKVWESEIATADALGIRLKDAGAFDVIATVIEDVLAKKEFTRPDCPACTQYLFIDGKLVREKQ